MAYSSTNPISMIDDGQGPLMPRTFLYSSTETSTDITATGFFTGVGAGGHGTGVVGLRVGDFLVNQVSTSSATPGRVTWHSCIASTANKSTSSQPLGFANDCTVSST